jgi:hypothetical protein
MAQDFIARGLIARSLKRQEPALEDFAGGTTKSAERNRDAFVAAWAARIDRIALKAGANYSVGTLADPSLTVTPGLVQQHAGAPPGPAIIIPKNLKLFEGTGATLTWAGANRGIRDAGYQTWAYPAVESYLGADVAKGDRTLTLEAGQGAMWAAGDEFFWMFGSFTIDFPETPNWGIAKVLAVAGDALTIDTPMPMDFAIASVAAQSYTDSFGNTRYNKVIRKWPVARGRTYRDFSVVGQIGTYSGGLGVVGGQRIAVEKARFKGTVGGVSLQYVDGATLTDVCAEDLYRYDTSVGKGIGLAEARGVLILNPRFRGCYYSVSLEANSEATVIGGLTENTGNPQTGASWTHSDSSAIFRVAENSVLTVRDHEVRGFGDFVMDLLSSGDGLKGRINYEGIIRVVASAEMYGMTLDHANCLLDYRINGGRELWDFRRTRTWKRRFYLKDQGGAGALHYGPPGVIREARIYASSGLTFGTGNQLTRLFVGKGTDNGIDYSANLVAGSRTTIRWGAGAGAGSVWANRSLETRINIVTNAAALDNANEYVDVEIDLAPDALNGLTFAWHSEDDERYSNAPWLREDLFKSHDLTSVAAQSAGAPGTLSVDFTIADIAAGDHILAVTATGGLGGLTCSALAAAGKATVTFVNQTGAAIDLATRDVKIIWAKSLLGA